MHRNKKSLLMLFLFSFFSVLVFAQNAPVSNATPLTSTGQTSSLIVLPKFDPLAANQILDRMAASVGKNNVKTEKLQMDAHSLAKLRAQARQCVDKTQEDLDEINRLFESKAPATEKSAKFSSTNKYLQNRKAELSEQLAQCQLFVLRSTETINSFDDAIKKLSARELLKINPHIVANIINIPEILKESYAEFSVELFSDEFGIDFFTKTALIFWFVIAGFFWYAGFLVKKFLRKFLVKTTQPSFSKKLTLAFITTTRRYVKTLLISSATSVYFAILSFNHEMISYLTEIIFTLTAYVWIIYFIRLILLPPPPATSLTDFPGEIAEKLFGRIRAIMLTAVAAFIIYALFSHQQLPLAAFQVARTFLVTAVTIQLLLIFSIVNHIPSLHERYPSSLMFANIVFWVSAVIILGAEMLGYATLANFVLSNTISSIAVLFATWFIHKLLATLLETLTSGQLPLQDRLRYHLGLKQHQSLTEFVWLKISIYIIVWGAAILALLRLWVLSDSEFGRLMLALMDGFTVGTVLIVPSHVFLAFFMFAILLALVRWLKNVIIRQKNVSMDKAAQESIAAIVGYVGVSSSLVISLIVAGVNFAGLAIIAGALSVGVGFGLQDVVKNFVSGLILLIERPIKPGDRVLVGQTEGHVRKISIRTTHIRTSNRSDVIVPNSELTSQQVTNLMFRDAYARFPIPIGVAYGSDVQLVKKLLLEIATQHPAIILDDPNYKPTVYFRDFGENAMNFQLWCMIRDVNNRTEVISDINFAIEKSFREHHIEIPFPQREVHVRNWPQAFSNLEKPPNL